MVLKQNFPEVESAAKMTEYERVVGYEDKLINEKISCMRIQLSLIFFHLGY